VDEVIAWPDIEAAPLPFGSGTLISFQVGEEVTTGDPFVFITGREFGRVFFAAPPIYLTLPLICAHRGDGRSLSGDGRSLITLPAAVWYRRVGWLFTRPATHARGGLSLAVLDLLQFSLNTRSKSCAGLKSESRMEAFIMLCSLCVILLATAAWR
jgi:hypothetical protein